MHARRHTAHLAVAVLAASALAGVAAAPAAPSAEAADAVVIAVIDNGFTVYHDDFRADLLPQHLDDDEGNDLPLDTSPQEWLPGFDASAFATFEELEVTLPEDEDDLTPMGVLYAGDRDAWSDLQPSTADEVHGVWVNGTKVIAGLSFGTAPFQVEAGTSHGVGTSSVSGGNVHGTCPECLLVLIRYDGIEAGEQAIEWAMQQPWIDVITNSYGFSAAVRDRVYTGSDVVAQREASHRGQTILFSAGNGQGNTFTVPNTTLQSSQEGPDWIITVGAVDPENHASYTGHGKPADIAAPGSGYPSAPSSGNAHGHSEGEFGGTSNATPVVAGIYAEALYAARHALAGPSRTQANGVVAVGTPVACGTAISACDLGDGALTAVELRNRLFTGAVHTDGGYTSVGLVNGSPSSPRVSWEHEFLNEGHGTYLGRIGDLDDELDRIVGPMLGTTTPPERPDGEAEWFVVDSYCRQLIHGFWDDGDWKSGDDLPAASPDWPTREGYLQTCEALAGQ